MEATVIEKSIRISATRDKVWDVLLQDEYNRIWFAEFSPGSHAETDWLEGSRVSFTDNSRNGITGKIVTARKGELMSIRYDGIVINNEPDFESDEAKQVDGAREIYTLTEFHSQTELHILCDMGADMVAMMSEAWDRALVKIKELAEAD
ncbi:MAG TPA: SRPBCC domain-containing protein [Flavobacterium sp.]|jgi:uncharacterized protein YndB with AHSA1/START domain